MESGENQSYWKNLTRGQKKLLIGLVVGAVVLTLFLLIILLLFQGPDECVTSTCAQSSLELLHYIDISKDPCEDFYQFSCGNFLKNAELDQRGVRSTKSILEEDIQSHIKDILADPEPSERQAFNLAKQFYRACMDENAIEAAGLKTLKQVFEQIGGWPTLTGNNWRENSFDWKDAILKFRRIGINVDFFLIHSIQKDKSDLDRYILNLKDPSYGPSNPSGEIKKTYLQYMVDIAILMGAEKSRAQKEQNEVLHFMLKLAKISEEAVVANGTIAHNPLSLSELDYEFPQLSWQEYLTNILAPATEITHDDVITVSNPIYLRKMLKLLQSTHKRVLANFICWHTTQNLVFFLPRTYYNKTLNLFKTINQNMVVDSRWRMCVNEAEKRFPFVISAAYVEKYLDEETRHRILALIRNIKYQFKENLYKLDWMDTHTKNLASGKVLSSVENIPSYNILTKYDNLYENVEVFEDKLLTSILNLDHMTANIQFGKLRNIYDEQIEKIPLTGINIEYSPKENSLGIPVGLLQRVLYLKDRPEYMNYGALGSVIAHELYHVITEAEAGLQGDLRSQWSSHSLMNYEEKLHCLHDQYNKFLVRQIQEQLNTLNSPDEDMADLAGIKVSYDTYRNWVRVNGIESRLAGLKFSPNQLFWISSAIPHCTKYSDHFLRHSRKTPAEFRVNGPLRNLEEFALDFGCPPESKMNPGTKCTML